MSTMPDQRSLTEQLNDTVKRCNEVGYHDAADWILEGYQPQVLRQRNTALVEALNAFLGKLAETDDWVSPWNHVTQFCANEIAALRALAAEENRKAGS